MHVYFHNVLLPHTKMKIKTKQERNEGRKKKKKNKKIQKEKFHIFYADTYLGLFVFFTNGQRFQSQHSEIETFIPMLFFLCLWQTSLINHSIQTKLKPSQSHFPSRPVPETASNTVFTLKISRSLCMKLLSRSHWSPNSDQF